MDRKQKEQLRVLQSARKRADKVLAEKRKVEQEKQDRKQRLKTNQEMKKQYAEELAVLAQECGILAMAERAAQRLAGRVLQEVSYHIDYGMTTSCLQQTLLDTKTGEIKASYLALRVTWEAGGALQEAEVRITPKGQVTFHNSLLPVPRLIWQRNPQVLEKMMASALDHPRPAQPLVTQK